MNNKTKHFTYESFFIPLLFILLLVNTLYRSEYRELFPLGDFTTTVSIVGMFVYLIKSFIDKMPYTNSLKVNHVAVILLMAVYLVSYFTYHELDLLLFMRLMLFFLFIVGSIRMDWNKHHLKMAGYIFSGAILFFFLHWISLGLPLGGFKSIFRNENYLGVLLFCFLYFNVLSIKVGKGKERIYFIGITLINLLLIVPTSARSVLIAIFVILAAWVVLKSFRKHFSKLFYIVMIGNILFVTIYTGLNDTRIGMKLNDISYSIFGKNLFSGRNEIWTSVIHALTEKPFFGFGVGTHAYNITDTSKTAHNMYLQVSIETGIIGLLIFILVLWTIWRLLNKHLISAVSKWSACFMLGILVYNNFELTLMNNNYSIALLQWLIMTIGINYTVHEFEHNKNRTIVTKN